MKKQVIVKFKGASSLTKFVGVESALFIRVSIMFDRVPPGVDTWICHYRVMDDGRCFVVTQTALATALLHDILVEDCNEGAREQLQEYFGGVFARLEERRNSKR